MSGGFDSTPLVTPGRYDFPQGAIYRLKITDIPGREGIELYPSLEVAPVAPRTAAFLAHNSIPFQLTEEDLDQVTTGNFVTKVVYLPDPCYQELAVAGVETLADRELEVFQMLGRGKSTKDIATALNLGESTVETYRARIKDKLQLRSAAELYLRAGQWVRDNGA
jgi:DNA-binding CsgD family transcriptional regulator